MNTSTPLSRAFDLSAAAPVIILLRHAARPPLIDGEHGGELAITSLGRGESRAYGTRIGPTLASIRTSPVRRCRETAEAIAAGAGFTDTIVDDPMLGAPGAFVTDPTLAWEHWRSRGHAGMLQHLASAANDDALSGMVSARTGARRIVTHLLDLAGSSPSLHLAITHDSLIIPTLATYWCTPLAEAEWPRFLEVVTLWRDNEQPRLAYRTRAVSVSR
jgi:broad specificity phosphatase PhoE